MALARQYEAEGASRLYESTRRLRAEMQSVRATPANFEPPGLPACLRHLTTLQRRVVLEMATCLPLPAAAEQVRGQGPGAPRWCLLAVVTPSTSHRVHARSSHSTDQFTQ